jgi:hypothetical protein
MDIVISVTSGSEHLCANGKIHEIINQLKNDNSYSINGLHHLFAQEVEFNVIHDGAAKRVESISELGCLSFELEAGKLVAKELTKHRGGDTVCRLTRQTVDRCAWAVVQLHKDNWVYHPEIEFKSELQLKTYCGAQLEDAGLILNRLAQDNTCRGPVRSRIKLILIQGGGDNGYLGIVKNEGVFKLSLDNGAVYETDVPLEVVEATSIRFTLKLGQKTVPDLSLLTNRIIRDLPNDPVAVLTDSREWLPSIGQVVNVEGRKEVFMIEDYDQVNDKFFLIIADSKLRHEDMINHRRERCRRFTASAPNLRPKVIRMSNPA